MNIRIQEFIRLKLVISGWTSNMGYRAKIWKEQKNKKTPKNREWGGRKILGEDRGLNHGWLGSRPPVLTAQLDAQNKKNSAF